MSMPSTKICCTGCDFETRELYSPIRIVYRWPSGKQLETGRQKGWCYHCDNYRDIENMDPERLASDRAEMERQRSGKRARFADLSKGFLAGIRNRSARRTLRHAIERLDEEIKETEELLDIATKRNSRSRCLTCWSEKTAPAAFDRNDDLTHDFKHACGGMLQIVRDPSNVRFHFALTTYVLNTDGEPLEPPEDPEPSAVFWPGNSEHLS